MERQVQQFTAKRSLYIDEEYVSFIYRFITLTSFNEWRHLDTRLNVRNSKIWHFMNLFTSLLQVRIVSVSQTITKASSFGQYCGHSSVPLISSVMSFLSHRVCIMMTYKLSSKFSTSVLLPDVSLITQVIFRFMWLLLFAIVYTRQGLVISEYGFWGLKARLTLEEIRQQTYQN